MLTQLFVFVTALFFVVRGATLATTYAARLAHGLRMSRYVVSFIVIAIISILPETFISISSSFQGVPAFGLGVLFASNIADLTLIFALIIAYVGRGLRVEKMILKNMAPYPFMLMLPIALGVDGYYSRLDGIVLLLVGCVFYVMEAKKEKQEGNASDLGQKVSARDIVFLGVSMVMLLAGAHFAVESAQAIAQALGVSPVLIGMLIVSLGTTMPELFFSARAVKNKQDAMAIGDILGTVLADATVVVGVLALVQPFAFPVRIVLVTGVLMVIASFVLFYFMRTGRVVARREAGFLFALWVVFVCIEVIIQAW